MSARQEDHPDHRMQPERGDDIEIRVCSEADVRYLAERGTPWQEMQHHQRRWAMQQDGAATYLLAWRGRELAGRCTLLARSKYPEVCEAYPDLREINALEARVPGRGVGTLLLTAAEAEARRQGARHIGLGVEPGNGGARRLYTRLGYADWQRGTVVDVWHERDQQGAVTREHRDPCDYLVKPLA